MKTSYYVLAVLLFLAVVNIQQRFNTLNTLIIQKFRKILYYRNKVISMKNKHFSKISILKSRTFNQKIYIIQKLNYEK